MRKLLCAFPLYFLSLALCAQGPDAAVMNKIRTEGLDRSRVMDFAFHLTDVSGPRLTNSPGYMNAANWARTTLAGMGLSNARVEAWGEFGKGWQQERSYIAMTKPYYQPLIGVPRAWTSGTPGKGVFSDEVLLITATDSAGLAAYAGKLKNRIIMTMVSDTLRPGFEPDARRTADSVLSRMASAVPRENARPGGNNRQPNPRMAAMQAFQRTLNKMITEERPALVLVMNGRGSDGTIFVSSGGQYAKDAVNAPASVALSSEDYLRMQRMLKAGVKVSMEAEVKTKFFDADTKGYNVIAEIPGTDPRLKDEVVMLGAHLDSWHGATGATDNAAGCAVMMEAVRIINELGLKPRRTIRIALWSGEEQGLHGSRNYVKNNFGDPATMKLTPAQEKVSAYYNLDNGTGRIRGIYLQGNEALAPLFSAWLEPFKDLGAGTVTINNTGSTDHVAFDAVGIPGFQFIQDPIEYSTRTHHTNMDTYDHLVPEDLKQAAVIVAAFVYNTAMRDEKLPRKPLPEPRTAQRGF